MLATHLQSFLCMLKLMTSKNNLKKVDSTNMATFCGVIYFLK